ncbi:MAG: SusC/RagA family TonB-linked outer membrane protein [Gemmatimonadaceae bacterium]
MGQYKHVTNKRPGATCLWRYVGAVIAICALLVAPLSLQAQQGSITGVVLESQSNQPLPGVQIAVVGTSLGARTDADGKFRVGGLSGDNATLRVTRIGYRALTREVKVGATDVRIMLDAVALQLDAAVVTGTPAGVQKRSVGNVVDEIKAADIVQKAPVTTMGDLLNARSAGVVLQNVSGMVGAGPHIRIRGPGSLSLSSEPLLYVDGVRVDNDVGTGPGALVSRLNDIDPSMIESIEIIKGPAAATLYGTEASRGVIQVITKRGTPGHDVIDIMARQGTNWMMDADNRFPTYYWRNPATGNVEVANLFKLESARGTPVFTTGRVQEYSIDAKGGSSAVSYYAAGGFQNNTGIEPTNGQKQFTGRANMNFNPRPSLDVAVSNGVVIGTTRLAAGTSGSSVLDEALWGGLSLLDSPTRGFLSAPPEAVWAATQRTLQINRYTGSIVINSRPANWLAQRLTTGVDISDQDGATLVPRMAPDVAQFYSTFDAAGSKVVDRTTSTYKTLDYSATGTFALSHALTSLSSIGGQYYGKSTRFEHIEGENFPAAGVTTTAGAAQRLGSDDYLDNTTVGLFFQEQIAWNNRVFLTGALRGDDNSAFGTNYKFVTYPKFSATWVITDEPFWHVPFVNALKLRSAYGASGRQPDAFAAIRTFAPRPADNGQAAVTPQSIGNPNLGPERSAELELGFDVGMLSDRLTAGLTYYNNNTTDAILLRDVAPSFGFPGAEYVNAGATKSHGLELQLAAQAVRRQHFALDLAANFASNASKIKSLGDQTFIAQREVGGYKTGYPIDAFFAKRVVSATLDATGTATDILCDGGPGAAPTQCSTAPRVYLGRTTPAITGSYSATATFFSRFRLYALIDYQRGFKKFNKEWWNRCPWGIAGNCPEIVYPEKFASTRIAEIQMGDIGTSSTAIEDGSFAKLREVSLNITLPQAFASHIGGRSASLTIAGRNLHTWTRYTGLDPEGLSTDAFAASRWGDQGAIPQLAQFLTTVNISF